MTLPYDYARCITQGCEFAAMCARKDPGRPSYQPIAKYPGGVDCHGFIYRGEE